MVNEKELLEDLKSREIDLTEFVKETSYTSRFKMITETIELLFKFIRKRECIKCKAILDDSHISSMVMPVMEDPVKTIIHTCPNCGYENGKQYESIWNEDDEDEDEVLEIDFEELGKSRAENKEGWLDR